MDPVIILAINPGSTSTKIAVYKNLRPVFQKSLRHGLEDLHNFNRVTEQFEFRKDIILRELAAADIDVNEIELVSGRGGFLKPISSGVYEVNERMLEDLRNNLMGEHASNLGGILAHEIAKNIKGAKAYISDPVVVDEFEELARYSGHPDFPRVSIFHALNQKAIARNHAKNIGRNYEDLNLIVAHLGGGISVGVHNKGKVIDANQALDGEGPFSPERSGTLPVGKVIDACFSGNYSKEELRSKVVGKGGLVAYLGTNSAQDIEAMIAQGNERARLAYEAMAYQVAKEIGACSTVLKGMVDSILLTGGIAYNDLFIQYLTFRIAWIAPVRVYPGEDEMRTLAHNALMVYSGEIEPKIYT